MVLYKEDQVQRPLNYAVIDEVDSILIDEARTPLIISGQAGQYGEALCAIKCICSHVKNGRRLHV